MDAKSGNSGGSKAAAAGGSGNGNQGSGNGGGGVMKAPGGNGAYISRDAFESNPKAFFSNLHENQKGNK